MLRHGAPFGDESALALDRLCGWARERITVALTGDGGDELFVGYRRRRLVGPLDALDRVLPGALRRTVARVAHGGAGGRGLLAQARRLLAALGDDAAGRYARWLAVQHDPASLRAVRRAVLAAGGPAAFDLRVYLPDDLLAKSDRAAMAHGLETRAPLCDPGLARLACALPARRHAPVPWRGKALVLAAFADLLPPGIARRPKRGFGVPVGAWLRRPGWHERLAQALRHPSFREAGVAPAAHLERLLAEHRAGRADHGRALYGLWTFACFVRLFVEGELVRHAPCPPRAATV
ncbi:MAG: hypothetical protein D6776_11670 [Planctomycetota bacterium]|nr:MAG: hypothetical protein D6776_11670 [Planctomycetota bacterium]